MGYTRLQTETAILSQNPLVHEVTMPQCEIGAQTVTDPTLLMSPSDRQQLEMIYQMRQQ